MEHTPTCRELLACGQRLFQCAGVDTPRLDAEVLLAGVMGVSRSKLYMRLDEDIPLQVQNAFEAAAQRRLAREPIAYITGVREFWSLPFRVTQDVLIPRPETELLVETVCEFLRRTPHTVEPPLVCEVGTGSGCIAISVAREVPEARVLANDLSPAALQVARQNARMHEVDSRVHFVRSNLLGGIRKELRFDVIASNPPYIADDADLGPEVGWEPDMALRAGPRGLDTIGELLHQAPSHLRPGGLLAVEIGYGQADESLELARSAGFGNVQIRSDLAGIPRLLTAV